MADSQNTYQNDVRIEESSNGFIKVIFALVILGVLGFFAYDFHTNAVEDAYNEGYSEGKDFRSNGRNQQDFR